MDSQSGYYRHPTIHADAIVFVCEDDLWRVPAGGGIARRLTASPSMVSFPVFSPDGRRIAFTARDDGPAEVYVMDADGGEPRRLTWLGAISQSVGWTRDGSAVLVASDWRQPFMRGVCLYAVPVDGGSPEPLGLGPATAFAAEPDGPGRAIGRNSGDPARWKRYRGGTAGTIWVDRRGGGDFRPLLRLEGNMASPMWIDGRIYFLADHEGYGNLYSTTPTGRGLRRHTDHDDFYVRFPSTDGERLVYHAGADLHLFDPASGRAGRVAVEIRSPRMQRRRRFVSGQRYIEGYDVHPDGHSLATVHRGSACTMALWEGAVHRPGSASGVRHRLARWLPDGKRLVAVSDAGGEESVVVLTADGSAPPRRIDGDFGRAIELAPAPAGPEWVALANHRQELIVIDLVHERSAVVEHSDHGRIEGLAWSSDGRWLAYGFPATPRTACIHLCEVATGTITEATRPDFVDLRPLFDPAGRYLYFLSWRVFDPVYDNLYFDLGFPRGARPHLITLRRDVVSPFSDATREPRPPTLTNGMVPGGGPGAAVGGAAGRPGEESGGRTTGDEPPVVDIDLEGIQERVVAFPVPEGRYEQLGANATRIFFSSSPIEGSLSQSWADTSEPRARQKLEAYDLEQQKTVQVAPGISDFRMAARGNALVLRIGNRLRVLPPGVKSEALPKGDRPGRESGWIDLDRVRVEVVPGAEWRQMFREAWRLQRDHFWTPDMSGLDWQQVHDRYLPLVDRVATRSEFSDLIWEMQGELGTSHCYELGGDYRPSPRWMQGHLGADLELDPQRGRWRIAGIPRGDSWDESRCSPLAAPGVALAPGDEILAIDGEPVGREVSPYERLVYKAKQRVELTVRSAAPARRRGGRGRRAAPAAERTVIVTTLGSEYGLRYRDWVERNRARVHAETDGRIGYVHVPNMGPVGYAEFHRYYMREVLRDGLIIDVRYNGGGHVSQLLLEKLLRRRVGYDETRWGQPEPYPSDAPAGPMVALTNEYAGSDGDIFSHCFKLYGLGPLIGKRTWGGVVGIWPRHGLIDGTITTQPEFAFWFEDVGWGVENYGTDPDIEVEIRPQDHAAGSDPQMDRAIREVERLMRRQPPNRPLFGERPRLRPAGLAPRVQDR